MIDDMSKNSQCYMEPSETTEKASFSIATLPLLCYNTFKGR